MDNFPGIADTPKRLGRERGKGFKDKYFESSSLPGEVIKEISPYDSSYERVLDLEVDRSDKYLEKLAADYGITVVPHRFVAGPSLINIGSEAFFCIEDRVERARPLESRIKVEDDDALRAANMLTDKLLDHIDDVIKNGGGLQPEFFRYDQYVLQTAIDSPVSLSERLVLVDVEPFIPLAVPTPEERGNRDDFSAIFGALEACGDQVIELVRHNRGSDTVDYLLSLVDSIPDAHGLDAVKAEFMLCVVSGDRTGLKKLMKDEFPVLI